MAYQNQDFLEKLEELVVDLDGRLNEGQCIAVSEIKRIKELMRQMGDIVDSFDGVQVREGQ